MITDAVCMILGAVGVTCALFGLVARLARRAR